MTSIGRIKCQRVQPVRKRPPVSAGFWITCLGDPEAIPRARLVQVPTLNLFEATMRWYSTRTDISDPSHLGTGLSRRQPTSQATGRARLGE